MSGEAFLLDITHGWGHSKLDQYSRHSPTEISVVHGKRFFVFLFYVKNGYIGMSNTISYYDREFV